MKEQGKNYALEPSNLIYNGPFVLEKWKHEQEFQLKKNDTYWDEKKVKLDEINFHIVKDTMTAVNLYEAGDLDRVPINSQFVDKYKGIRNYTCRVILELLCYVLMKNTLIKKFVNPFHLR